MKRRGKPLPEWFTQEYANTHTAKEIADLLCVTPQSVIARCKRREWQLKHGWEDGLRRTLDKHVEEVTGMTASEVANKYGFDLKSVWDWSKKRGIPLKKKQKITLTKIGKKHERPDIILDGKIRMGSFETIVTIRPKPSYRIIL